MMLRWNDKSTYYGGNPRKAYNFGDPVPEHVFSNNMLRTYLNNGIVKEIKIDPAAKIKLSISVMAHPKRAEYFPRLREALGDVPFSIDQNNSLLENCKASWRLHDPEADFHVVIQDDAILCKNFQERAEKFIAQREAERLMHGWPVWGYNFFIRQEYKDAQMREYEKKGYYTEGRNRGGVAICLPVNQINSMLQFFDTLNNRHDDERISQWIIHKKFKICFPIPSLVDHNDHNPSLAGNPIKVNNRQAYKFIDDQKFIVPKIIHQMWIGPHEPPKKWMQTWKDKNPGWLYRLWTEKEIMSNSWTNWKHIDHYYKNEVWCGVKDVCQYEILYNHGGVFIDADTECLEPIGELFDDKHDAYSYWENEKTRPGFVQPILAAVKGSQFAKELIDGISKKPLGGTPFKVTGNQYVGEMYNKTLQAVKIFPSHYFNPEHFTGQKYQGTDKIYARHYYGSTVKCTYEKGESKVVIPKIINQLWIGPGPRPEKWMKTWSKKNPDWEYRLWTEKDITGRKWINQAWIDFFWAEKVWNGVKNICQYEMLLEQGGAFFDADTECLLPIDDLFTGDYDCFSYWENETARPGMIQPPIGAAPGSEFLKAVIEGIRIKEPHGVSFQETGNKYIGEVYAEYAQKETVKLYPSYMFNPEHFTGVNPEAKGKIYSRHFFGSTVNSTYEKGV